MLRITKTNKIKKEKLYTLFGDTIYNFSDKNTLLKVSS